MRNQIISALTIAALSLPTVASANSVYNRYETTNEVGTRDVQVDRVRVENGTINDIDVSIKLEADKGDFNSANINFDGKGFTGSASSSNSRPVDPVVYGTFTRTETNTNFSQTDNTKLTESVKFTGNIYQHSVGNDN